MAKFIRMEILQYRDPDNTPNATDDDATTQIMIDAEKYWIPFLNAFFTMLSSSKKKKASVI